MAYAPPSFVSGYPPGAAPVHYPTAPGAPQASSGTHGTVAPVPNFNPIADAEALRKAMKGFGTDEKAIIEVLTHRSAAQRLEIAKAFKMSFGKDLIADLKSELTGNFEDVIVALVQERSHYEAACLRKAMKGAGTDDHVLIELILTRSNAEIKATKAAYTEQFQRDLEADVSSETSGYFRRILVSALQAFRPDTATVDVAQAQQDAKALFEAGEKRFGTDESVFNQILMSRSPAQLRVTFQEYYNLSHHDILHAIENEMSGDVKKAYKAIAHSVIDAPAFFAGRLYKSMDGVGTSDDDLIRLVVTRSEVDMVEIKAAFEKEFGKTLARMIEGDCKGDYKRALLALIGA